jgi:exo-beta-1,3-glucanase (GH17 family)
LSNVHAWFADVTANQASEWVFEFFQDTNVAEAQAVSNHPDMYIAETGWPTVCLSLPPY